MRGGRIALPCFLLMLGGACGRTAIGWAARPDASANTQDDALGASNTSQPPIDGGQCSEGLTACGKGDSLRCHDLHRSKDHCGACGQACAPGIACQAGTCQQYRCAGPLSFRALPYTSTVSKDGIYPWFYRPALGDFDSDGILDLVGASGSGAPMSLLYGAGDGTFPSSQVIDSTLNGAWQAIAADLDGDGFLDLTSIDTSFVPDMQGAMGTAHPVVTVRRGSGNRAAELGEATTYPTSNALNQIVLADFDADGRPDLVVRETSALDYWRGVAGGRFEHQATLDARSVGDLYWGGLLAMDWNSDGLLDLVYGNLLSFRLGRGDGSFDPEVPCALPMGAVGDLDNDHRPDLISGKNLLLGLDDCHAAKLVQLRNWPELYGSLVLADLNGDGALDVVGDLDTSVIVLAGDGQGGFAQPLPLAGTSTQGPASSQFVFGDLNRDGKLDILYARQDGWGVFLNTCR